MKEYKVVEYNNKYGVSKCGSVFNYDRGCELVIDNSSEYSRVTFVNGDDKRKKLIHRLVAEAYIPNPDNKEFVNHIDGNKRNNNVSNLEWVTNQENMIHAMNVLKINYNVGREPKSVIDENGNTYFSIKSMSKTIGVCPKTIRMRISSGRYKTV